MPLRLKRKIYAWIASCAIASFFVAWLYVSDIEGPLAQLANQNVSPSTQCDLAEMQTLKTLLSLLTVAVAKSVHIQVPQFIACVTTCVKSAGGCAVQTLTFAPAFWHSWSTETWCLLEALLANGGLFGVHTTNMHV